MGKVLTGDISCTLEIEVAWWCMHSLLAGPLLLQERGKPRELVADSNGPVFKASTLAQIYELRF